MHDKIASIPPGFKKGNFLQIINTEMTTCSTVMLLGIIDRQSAGHSNPQKFTGID